MDTKKTLFISHSAPEDNYLASWLASKLKLLGYHVWVDIEDLRSGSSFWPKIEDKIRNKSIRFLALITQSYIQKSRIPKSGVLSEVMCAHTVEIENFIIPIRCDTSSYSDFPVRFLEFNAIDFSANLGAGLKKLVNELKESNIETANVSNNVLKEWFEAQKITTDLINRKEQYYSSWFDVSLPRYLYVHYPIEDFGELGILIPYSFIRNGDYFIGLFSVDDKDFESSFSQKILVNEFYKDNQYKLENGEIVKDTQNKVINLLNKSFASFLYTEGYRYYIQSNGKKVFYTPYSSDRSGYVSLKHFKKRGRTLFGKHMHLRWRFAISFNFQLNPIPYLNTQYHLVFSDEAGFLDVDGQQKYRRSMPKDWFNRTWYERLIAMMYHISNKNEKGLIEIKIDKQKWSISVTPFHFISEVGYHEPIKCN